MGGGGFGRAYASGSNTQINQAALAKAVARAPKTVGSVIKKQQEELADLYSNPFASTIDSPSIGASEPVKVVGSKTEPAASAFKVGDRENVYDDAGNKIGFTLYKEQKSYDGYGNVTGSKVVPRTTYYAPSTVQKTAERKESYGDKSIADIAAQLGAEAPAKARTAMDLYSEFDPNRGAMQGYNVESYNKAVNYDRPLLQAFKDLEVPAYKEFDVPELDTGDLDYDKTKLYTNYGKRGQLEFPNEAARQEYYKKERTGTFHDISELLGLNPELGQQTMVWVENPPEPSKWEKFLGNPVLSVIGMLNPAIGLATTAAKATSGMKVSPVEIASSLLTGLEMSGAIKAPVAGSSAAPKGGVGPTLPSQGTGLFGSTFAQTQTALNVAAAGDAEGAALALVGDKLITGGLDKVGLDQATIENAGIQYDDFQAGVGKVVSEVAGGAELDDALVQGLGKYIREGGTLGSVDLPSVDLGIDLSGLKDVIEPIVETVEDIGRPIVKLVEDAGRPIVEAAEDVARPVGDIVEDVAQGAGDVLSDLDTAVRQALPDIDLPSVNLNLGGLLTGAGAVAIPQLSATRTTDDLFKDELFKFQTEIGVDVEPLEYVDLNAPAENFFEDPILGRSYNF